MKKLSDYFISHGSFRGQPESGFFFGIFLLLFFFWGTTICSIAAGFADRRSDCRMIGTAINSIY